LCFRSNSLYYTEIALIINLIYDFELPHTAAEAISHLADNMHGVVTLPEFVLLCRHYPVLLHPIVRLRDHLRTRIVFRRFWMQLAARRIYYCGEQHAFDIVGSLTVEQQSKALRKLIVGNHFVPPAFSDKWLEQVSKKPSDVVEKLPFEIDPDYVPPPLPIPQPKLPKVTPEATSKYKEQHQQAEETSRNNHMLSRRNSRTSTVMKTGGVILPPTNSNNNPKTGSVNQPYVARKPLIEDDRDIKKLLKKINKEVRRHVAMSKIDSRSARGSRVAPSATSSATHSVVDDSSDGPSQTPDYSEHPSRRFSFTNSSALIQTMDANDDDIDDPDDGLYNDDHFFNNKRTSRRWSKNVKRAVY
jgi:hypothetical protein